MKTSDAIRILVEYRENNDYYNKEQVDASDTLKEFVTRWESTIDVLGEAEPGKVLNELIAYLMKSGASF